jgi:hypothetical protein
MRSGIFDGAADVSSIWDELPGGNTGMFVRTPTGCKNLCEVNSHLQIAWRTNQ